MSAGTCRPGYPIWETQSLHTAHSVCRRDIHGHLVLRMVARVRAATPPPSQFLLTTDWILAKSVEVPNPLASPGHI
jgi:hypothetical protein